MQISVRVVLVGLWFGLNKAIGYTAERDIFSLRLIRLTFFLTVLIVEVLTGDYKLKILLASLIRVRIILVLGFVFISINLLRFYFIFEFVVVPIFLLIIIVGMSIERLQSALYLFLYTLVSSIPFLVFALVIYLDFGSLRFFSIETCFYPTRIWWLAISLVFLVKLPVFIVHIWLPKAHVEAPLVGSIILAGVLLKLGGFGFYRAYSLFESGALSACWLYVFVGLYGGVVISVVCLSQVDIRALIAFSSIVHIGPALRGLVRIAWLGLTGRLLIILSHGIRSSGIFYLINLCYERLGSRSALVLKGVNIFLPSLVFLIFLLVSSNISVPPSFNFCSELILVLALFRMSTFVRVVLLLIFVMVGIYNVFFYVSIAHRDKGLPIFTYFESTEKEIKIISFHSTPIYIFALWFFLWCLCSLYKILSCGLREFKANVIPIFFLILLNNSYRAIRIACTYGERIFNDSFLYANRKIFYRFFYLGRFSESGVFMFCCFYHFFSYEL